MQATVSTPSTVSTVSAFASMMASPSQGFGHVFRPKSKGTAKDTASSATANLPKGVQSAISTADKLVADYTKLKVEVLDRSDRALWEMLQEVYGFVDQTERSPIKRETRNELIKKIQQRDSQGMASNASMETVVVRYVFADQSRQSRNNYTIAMEKARALSVAVKDFADFLAQHGGVGKVVEAVFDFEADDQASAKDLADALKAEKVARSQLVSRLYSALAHTAESQISYSGLVTNWVPEKPKTNSDAKGKATDKADPKFESGRFVFFVTVRNAETGKFHVVQGNLFDQAYEEQLLASIAERMDVDTQELTATVQGLEDSIGFEAMDMDPEGTITE